MWELDVKTYFGLLLVGEAEQLLKHGSPGLELQEVAVYTYFTKALLLESQVGISSQLILYGKFSVQSYHTIFSSHVILQFLLLFHDLIVYIYIKCFDSHSYTFTIL